MIIDIHTHAFPSKIAEKTMGKLGKIAGIPYYGDGTSDAVQKNIEKAGVDVAVILTIATRPDNIEKINDYAMERDGFISGNEKYARHMRFCSVHPDSPNAVEELVRLKNKGVKGVKFHPDYQEFMIDDKKMYPIYEAVSELGLVAVFHAGYDPLSPELIHALPEASARVLADFPKMKTVLAHLGGMHRFDEVNEYLAGRFPNLYLDTAFLSQHISPERLVKTIGLRGADKILFGSDFPWSESLAELLFIEALPVGRTEKDLIMGDNARELLGI